MMDNKNLFSIKHITTFKADALISFVYTNVSLYGEYLYGDSDKDTIHDVESYIGANWIHFLCDPHNYLNPNHPTIEIYKKFKEKHILYYTSSIQQYLRVNRCGLSSLIPDEENNYFTDTIENPFHDLIKSRLIFLKTKQLLDDSRL